MSWTNECTESNKFTVKDVNQVKHVLEDMGFDVYRDDNSLSFVTSGEGVFFNEDTQVVLQDGEYIGIISDYIEEPVMLDEDGTLNGQEVKALYITDYLQEQLSDDKQYIAVTCAGYEGRSSGSYSPFGDVTVITKNNTEFVSLQRAIDNILAKNNITES